MNISLVLALLVLESILLVVTIILLVYSIREGKERNMLLKEMMKTTKVLTRQEYFTIVVESLQRARKEVIGCITGSFPEEIDRVEDIAKNIAKLSKKVKIKYLIPKFPDRLYIGYIYTKAGAEVCYYPFVSDFRYMVVDRENVIIGVPEVRGEKEPTKKGYNIPSEELARLLKEHFYSCWKESTKYEDYVKEILKETHASPKQLAQELHIDEREIERIQSLIKKKG